MFSFYLRHYTQNFPYPGGLRWRPGCTCGEGDDKIFTFISVRCEANNQRRHLVPERRYRKCNLCGFSYFSDTFEVYEAKYESASQVLFHFQFHYQIWWARLTIILFSNWKNELTESFQLKVWWARSILFLLKLLNFQVEHLKEASRLNMKPRTASWNVAEVQFCL